MKYDPFETARRLRIVRTYVGCGDSQTRFAERYGFTIQQWNNLERGHPLPRDAAIELVRLIA
jgi:DNA-binding transcriptional regulator YiaG